VHFERLVDYWTDTEVFDHADHPLEHVADPTITP